MEEIQVRLLDGSGPKVLTEKLLAQILGRKMRQYLTEVFDILREHASDRDFAPFAPGYIKWVVRGVRDSIEENCEKRRARKPTKKLFGEILAEESKGFQKDKGGQFIAEIVWSKFQKLRSEEYSEKVFRQIIDEAVLARQNFNAERSAHFREINYLKKMARESVGGAIR